MDALIPTELENIKKFVLIINSVPHMVGMMYRIWIPKIIDSEIKKLIYIDSDTVVNFDIKELYDIDIEDSVLAAVPESANDPSYINDKELVKAGIVMKKNYFNSGVLIINTERLRESQNAIEAALYFLTYSPQLKLRGFCYQ